MLQWRYDEQCKSQMKQVCNMKILVSKKVPKDSVLFLKLHGFRQNDRIMMNSWSHTQLMGNEVPIEELSQVCRPDITNQDMNAYHAVNGKELVKNEIARPCGLLAKYFPQGKQNFVKTDSFEFFKQSGKEIKLSTTGIAWEGLKGTKFRSTDKSKEWADIEDERFINWMRPNTFPNVYKAWGRLEEEIEPGLYTAKIKNGKFLIIQKIWILIYLWARSISVLQL